MKEFCENEHCDNPATHEVAVSENAAGDSKRSLCAVCEGAYSIGVQHGEMMSNHKDRWGRNEIQFPRLIGEASAAGAFTVDILKSMSESMDLEIAQVEDILERARFEWERIRQSLLKRVGGG